MSAWNPPHSWYEPPENLPCCSLAEDDPDHDSEQCREEAAEAAVERRVDLMREREMDWEERP